MPLYYPLTDTSCTAFGFLLELYDGFKLGRGSSAAFIFFGLHRCCIEIGYRWRLFTELISRRKKKWYCCKIIVFSFTSDIYLPSCAGNERWRVNCPNPAMRDATRSRIPRKVESRWMFRGCLPAVQASSIMPVYDVLRANPRAGLPDMDLSEECSRGCRAFWKRSSSFGRYSIASRRLSSARWAEGYR